MSDLARYKGQKRIAGGPVMLAGATGEHLPTPRLPLKTLDAVRLEMARVYRAMKCGQLDPSVGTKLAFVLSQIGRLIVDSDMDRRIAALETTMAGERDGQH